MSAGHDPRWDIAAASHVRGGGDGVQSRAVSGSTPTPGSTAPDLGKVVDGRYRLLEQIGQGGMGAVYRAEHLGMGKVVALKVLRPELGGQADALTRFEREAQAAARVDHKNVVAVSDFGAQADGSLYLAMEYLRGETLRHRLDREGRIEWSHAVNIARHVARGLAHAHGQGVVHRDIKPENIFLVEDDDDPDFAKILDFGIARSLSGGDARVTQAGIVIGTPAYLSPEQALGGAVDTRSDQYSLATVLFEMLTGVTPFGDREPVAILTAHAVAPVPAMDDVVPGLGVPGAIEAIVRRALAKEKSERYPDTAAFLAALDQVRVTRSVLPQVAEVVALDPPGRPLTAGPGPGRPSTAVPAVAAAVTGEPVAPGSADQPVEGMWAWLLRTFPWLADRARVKRLAIWIGGGVLLVGVIVALRSSGGGSGKSAPAPLPGLSDLMPGVMEERYQAALRDLTRGKTCPDRRDAVQRLRALGDPRAIGPLKRARYRMRGGVLGIGDSNTNSCLRADAEAAIAELSRKAPASSP